MEIEISEKVSILIPNKKHSPIIITDDESAICLSNTDAKKLVYELNQHFLRNNR